jgi:hypothetical protein
MKTFNKTAAQGDVFFIRRDKMPVGVIPAKADKGRVVVTHSETGHDHVMVLDREAIPAVEMFNDKDNALISWLKVNRPTALEHQRPHDTHEPIMFSPGIYEVRRQREYTPEGFRRVED